MFKQRIFILILPLILFGCGDDNSQFRDKFRWISGKWEGKDGETKVIEQWKWNRFRFEGEGYRIADGDTTSTEALFISSYGEIAGYTSYLNNDQLWTFQEEKAEKHKMVFVHPTHDFPKRITYALIQDSILRVSLEGEINRDPLSISYDMKRTTR